MNPVERFNDRDALKFALFDITFSFFYFQIEVILSLPTAVPVQVLFDINGVL